MNNDDDDTTILSNDNITITTTTSDTSDDIVVSSDWTFTSTIASPKERDSFEGNSGIMIGPRSNGKCSACKKDDQEIIREYNWGDEEKITRKICVRCHTKALDKFYGLDRNIDSEETLYAKKEK